MRSPEAGGLPHLHDVGAGRVLAPGYTRRPVGGRGHGRVRLLRLLDHPDQQRLDAEEAAREREGPQQRRDDRSVRAVPRPGDPDGLQDHPESSACQQRLLEGELRRLLEAGGQDLGQRAARPEIDLRPDAPASRVMSRGTFTDSRPQKTWAAAPARTICSGSWWASGQRVPACRISSTVTTPVTPTTGGAVHRLLIDHAQEPFTRNHGLLRVPGSGAREKSGAGGVSSPSGPAASIQMLQSHHAGL